MTNREFSESRKARNHEWFRQYGNVSFKHAAVHMQVGVETLRQSRELCARKSTFVIHDCETRQCRGWSNHAFSASLRVGAAPYPLLTDRTASSCVIVYFGNWFYDRACRFEA